VPALARRPELARVRAPVPALAQRPELGRVRAPVPALARRPELARVQERESVRAQQRATEQEPA
jgi:hypothetical protein